MTTWVLLRGLMREARHWGEFSLLFREAIGSDNIVTLDFPGNGSLHAQTSASTVAALADHCRAELRRLGYPPPYNVLALSLGAMVAVAWGEQHQDEIARMVLINTSLAPYNPFYHRLRPANYFRVMRFLLDGSAVRRENLILNLTSAIKNRSGLRQDILERWLAYARECPVARANMLRQLGAAMRYRAAPIQPPMPVLLLAGARDQLVNAKCSLKLAQHWQCAIRVHPEAGHDLPLDDDAWVIRQVRDWLGEQSASRV
jgi:pimeloyl-ACP methyl ester carboxylesterase